MTKLDLLAGLAPLLIALLPFLLFWAYAQRLDADTHAHHD